MVFDIIIIVLLLIFAIWGFRKGFVYSLIKSVGWIVALTGSVFGIIYLSDFLKENGFLYKYLTNTFISRFSAETDTLTPAISSMPKSIGEVLDQMVDGITNSAAEGFAGVCYTIILFAVFFLVLKFFMWIILRGFSKKYNDGFSGFLDGITGAAAGLLCGAIFVSLLLLVIIPVSNLIDPGLTEQFVLQMDQSFIARYLYDNNFLQLLIQGFFGLS